MKPLFLAILVAAVATAFLINPAQTTLAQTEPTQPPGVSEDSWIPLSDRAGILITVIRSGTNRPQGRVLVEIDGQWTDIDLLSRSGFVPLTDHP